MTARELRDRLLAEGVIVTLPAPGAIELEAVMGGVLPPELVTEAKRLKPEFVQLLEWEQRANALLLATTRRLAAAWHPDAPELAGDVWEAFEEGITEAYHAQDTETLCRVLTERERYAMETFKGEVQP
jgi:hypothetical protein